MYAGLSFFLCNIIVENSYHKFIALNYLLQSIIGLFYLKVLPTFLLDKFKIKFLSTFVKNSIAIYNLIKIYAYLSIYKVYFSTWHPQWDDSELRSGFISWLQGGRSLLTFILKFFNFLYDFLNCFLSINFGYNL